MDKELKEKSKELYKRLPPEDSRIVRLLLVESGQLRDALRGIKLGVTHTPPEHSYGDWTRKELRTYEALKSFAAEELKRIGDYQ